jgi:hypothetical protein
MVSNIGLADRVQGHGVSWGRFGFVVAAYVLVVGAASVTTYLPAALGGEPAALVRVALGLLGTVAGVVLWTQPAREVLGWRLAMLWALGQIPVFAWNEYGSATLQLLHVPLAFSERITANGEVTSYSQFGVNVLAVILAAICGKRQTEALLRTR